MNKASDNSFSPGGNGGWWSRMSRHEQIIAATIGAVVTGVFGVLIALISSSSGGNAPIAGGPSSAPIVSSPTTSGERTTPTSPSSNQRQWRTLRATVGLRDDSPQNEKYEFQVFADGHPIYSHLLALGQSQNITLNIAGVLRLELRATLSSSAFFGEAYGVWGNVRLAR